MTTTLPAPRLTPVPPSAEPARWWRRPIAFRYTPLQLTVLLLASIGPLIAGGAIAARLLDLASTETMITVALQAGENPGMIVFGAMFLCSPVQWFTGRSQVRVRKYLGIVFFLLAFNNGAMFVIEEGVTSMLDSLLLVAGTVALAVSFPLFLTSSRRAQRSMGMARWRRLHKATYLVAAALVAHEIFLGDPGAAVLLISLGTVARIPTVRRRLTRRGADRPR